jgi:hypothetical protein
MATVRIKNISGIDRDVPTPDGGWVQVPAGHSAEFDADHAKGLLQQKDAWDKYESEKKTDAKDKE